MKFKLLMMSVLLGLGLISASVNAAYVQLSPSPQTNDGSITLPNGFTATYLQTAPVSSIWFNSDVSPQNDTTVENSITTQFGGSLTLVGQENSFTSGNVSLNNPFNVLAVHLGGKPGKNELLFFFSSLINSFTVNSFNEKNGTNLSNFRAYAVVNPVPVPAAVWLFGSGLAGLVASARRKSKTAIQA